MARDWMTTSIGPINFESNQYGLVRIGWGEVTRVNSDDPQLEITKKWLSDYFGGKVGELPTLDETALTKFQSKVLGYLRDKTTTGQTITYSDLATAVGHSNASRAVGSVMAMNPWPLLVPCHRVVCSDVVIGNYSGEGGSLTKTRLLLHEGLKFDSHGKLAH